MKIAIHQNTKEFTHSTSWSHVWISYCEKNNIDFEIVNCYENGILEYLNGFDVLLWHFGHYSHTDKEFARTILLSIQNLGIKIFPDYNTNWHFDDKIAENYLLASIGAPMPRFWNFYNKESAYNFFEEEIIYPIVAKLKGGSGSHNVKLIKSKKEGKNYTDKMFGKGINPSPNIIFKTKSNLQTAKNFNTVISRVKRIPDFVNSINKAKELNLEKGYVSLQEFIPNEGFDLKVVVVGDKLSFLARDVRKGDFRASGGGAINYDKSLITPEIRRIAFEISEKLDFQCMGYDFVVDSRDNSAKIIEISYGFSHTAQFDLGGYWTKEGVYVEEPLNAPEEVIKMLIKN